MNTKGTILVITSNAKTITLRSGKEEPIGYYLNELAIPMKAAVDAGYEMVLATPTGQPPTMDPESVVASHFGNSKEALQQALDFANTHPAMQKPRSFRSVIDEGLDRYVGLYAPGGHPPMVDLMQDLDLGEILRHMHSNAKTTALLCHGPMAIAAAMPNAREFRAALVAERTEDARALASGWQYAGYRMTVFSNDEERYAEEHYLGGGRVPFYPNDALKIAGGDVSISDQGIFQPLVVEDRELITGQNPPSDHEMARYFVKALDRSRAHEASSAGRVVPSE